MPTTRLMQFSSNGGDVETTSESGQQNTRSIPGVSSAHFLKLVEERGQIGFWTMDFTTERMTTSIGLYRLLGLDPSAAFSWGDLMNMIHPDDECAQRNVLAILHSGQPINGEFRIIRPDGTVRWLQNKAEVIVGADGRPFRAVGLMMDITDQHEARKSVHQGWHRYKLLVSAIASIEWSALANGEVTSWPGWEELTGQTSAETAGWGWLDAIHPDDREVTRREWLLSLDNGTIHAVDFRVRCADGSYRWFLSRAAPSFNQDGTVREWMGALIAMVSGDSDRGVESVYNLEAAYIRAARALLNWTIEDLAFKAEVSVSSIRRLEREGGNSVRNNVHAAVRTAFEACGISFTGGQNGEIMLRFLKPA